MCSKDHLDGPSSKGAEVIRRVLLSSMTIMLCREQCPFRRVQVLMATSTCVCDTLVRHLEGTIGVVRHRPSARFPNVRYQPPRLALQVMGRRPGSATNAPASAGTRWRPIIGDPVETVAGEDTEGRPFPSDPHCIPGC